MGRNDVINRLNDLTQSGRYLCGAAYDYADGDEVMAVAYLRAKGLAFGSPGQTFDQRVAGQIDAARDYIQRHDAKQ